MRDSKGEIEKAKEIAFKMAFFILLLEGLENKCSIIIYLRVGVFSPTFLVAKSLI